VGIQFISNWKFYEHPSSFYNAVVIKVSIRHLLNCSIYSKCKKVSGSRGQLIIDCLYYVNKQLTQLSIYHLMQHVSTFKMHRLVKILVKTFKGFF
jgi:hypothetical protein